MSRTDNPSCIYCRSSKVIKHGKTNNGHTRYRCRVCGRTWVLEKYEQVRPDISDIVDAYLSGRTYRDLVHIYHSSPLRINQKIREFLEGCPDWEDYLDACVKKHEPRMIYLFGKEFACACENSSNNKLFLALAVDALSTNILSYEIFDKESTTNWMIIIDRLYNRKINCSTFLTNGSDKIEKAILTINPKANVRIPFHKTYRDKELNCCLSRFAMNTKLLNDAINAYESLQNQNLKEYLEKINEQKLRDLLYKNPESFIKRLKERMQLKPKTRIEGLINAFQSRFEKFHMLKDDPKPIVNGWIARFCLQRMDIGFSRLSFYTQIPSSVTLKDWACGNKPRTLYLQEDSPLLKSFVVEITARGLQLPVFYFRCEMKLDKCSLF